MKLHLCIAMAIATACACPKLQAQTIDSTIDRISNFPNRIFGKIKNREEKLDASITRKTERYLQKLEKKERKLQQKLYKSDSVAAKQLFTGSFEKYETYKKQLKNQSTDSSAIALSGEYLPYPDSLNGSLAFLQQSPARLSSSPGLQNQVAAARQQFNQLQSRFQSSEQVKEFIRQRKQQLKDALSKYANSFGYQKYLDAYNQQAYYYSEQIREYKQLLNDPDRLEQKLLTILNRLPAFQDFMKNNSQLAGLFNVPAGYGSAAAIEGLQTKDQVQQLLQSQVGASGSSGMAAMQSNLSSAHQQLDQFKDKLGNLGGGSGDMDMPTFTPNNQRTKPLLKRLELGTNIQTQKTTYYFPTTTDIGLSLGYKFGNKITAGIGASYKIGWGTGISHIALSSQGAGLRLFIDVRAKGNLYISGGFEYNYQQPFSSYRQIQNLSAWQQSGLIGVSKMVSLPGKFIKKTKLQLLWDFLSYSQLPETSPVKFRVGYNF